MAKTNKTITTSKGLALDGDSVSGNLQNASQDSDDSEETLGGGLSVDLFYDHDDSEVSDEQVYAGMARRGVPPKELRDEKSQNEYRIFLKTFKKH